MRILLTGGNDVLQHTIVDACVRGGHQVRVVVARGSASVAWPAQVEPLRPPALTADAYREVALDCDAVIALSPAITPSVQNRDAVRMMDLTLEAAGRSGIGRLLLITTLDDPSGDLTAAPPRRADGSSIDWLVVRTAPVYGVSDDGVTLFVIMMRSLPAVPVLPDTIHLQPVWHEDLAGVVAGALTLPASDINRTITIVGPDAMTADDLYTRIAALIDRRPLRVPVPEFVATVGRRLSDALPVPDAWSQLFAPAVDRESTTLPASFASLVQTDIDRGLRQLITQLPEITPAEGVGTLEVKTFAAVIHGTAYAPESLLSMVRTRFAELMPVAIGVEPAAPDVELAPGAVVTIALPGRGHVQIRVEDVQPTQVVVATLRGHVVAGIVQFSTAAVSDGVRFEVMTCDRAANVLDWISLTLGGARLQDANWMAVVTNVIRLSGGQSDGVRVDRRQLPAREA